MLKIQETSKSAFLDVLMAHKISPPIKCSLETNFVVPRSTL